MFFLHIYGKQKQIMALLKKLFFSALVTSMLASNSFAADVLHLYNWNNYLAPETVKRFEASCKCKLVQDYYSDNEEMLAKLAAGAKGYDVIVPTGYAITTLLKQNALQPVDKAKLPNFKNLNAGFLGTEFDKQNQYSVPYAYTITLVGYNEQKLKALNINPASWSVIFDPTVLQKIKGHVTVLDSPRELVGAALKYLGYSANSTNAAELAKAKDVILKAKPYWAAFNGSSYIKELTLGNIWVAHGYSNDMYQAQQDAIKAKRPFTIGFTMQKEGNTLSLDSMVIHKAAPRPDLAHKFMNFMLEAQSSAELANLAGSGSPNTGAEKFIKPDVKKNRAIFPDKTELAKLEQLKDFDAKNRRALNKIWTDIKVK